ncbi:hypothetical protein ACF08N_16690 [Streptomyces sp. NPDC015127]|uniref:hypothetical protein n=1 Tax=Streptomyces sp. NPDC015127 TaxID=3364939 RepID=UPI003702D3A9
MTGLDERSAFDGRPTSDLIADQVLERVLVRARQPWEWGIEVPNGGVRLDLPVADVVEISAARKAIETTAAAALPASSREPHRSDRPGAD